MFVSLLFCACKKFCSTAPGSMSNDTVKKPLEVASLLNTPVFAPKSHTIEGICNVKPPGHDIFFLLKTLFGVVCVGIIINPFSYAG